MIIFVCILFMNFSLKKRLKQYVVMWLLHEDLTDFYRYYLKYEILFGENLIFFVYIHNFFSSHQTRSKFFMTIKHFLIRGNIFIRKLDWWLNCIKLINPMYKYTDMNWDLIFQFKHVSFNDFVRSTLKKLYVKKLPWSLVWIPDSPWF